MITWSSVMETRRICMVLVLCFTLANTFSLTDARRKSIGSFGYVTSTKTIKTAKKLKMMNSLYSLLGNNALLDTPSSNPFDSSSLAPSSNPYCTFPQSPPPPPMPLTPIYIPPILPIQNPPPSPFPLIPPPPPVFTIPSPGQYIPSPTPPKLVPSPFISTPQPSPPEIVPSPIIYPSPPRPYFSPPPSFEPSPPSIFVPSPSVFQPPIVFPPPRVPPPPTPKTALWCVAKPSVPDPIILEAMNYACGSGADCESIQPNGSCFRPDTLYAHASYAFNSYWQRNKAAGGTCDFGGISMLVTVDPSYDGCNFIYYTT